MINPDAKLSPKIFSSEGGSASGGDAVEMKPTRDGFGVGVLVAGDKDKNVVVLSADLIESTRSDAFAK
ncbi:MAG: hypothetical protein AAB867_00860, partial [Patescibacteria group bacterium]